MRERWLWALVVIAVATLGLARAARADGVCVSIDVSRDNLAEPERVAVRIAILDALEREGVAVDRSGGACGGVVSAYSLKLGKAVTTTIGSGDHQVAGRASSLDEVDLLIRQLVRSMVTGRSLATGSGVTDRENVLRDQTAPRRSATSARRWDRVIAVGGGMLQLPAIDGRPRQRQRDIVAIEARWWGVTANERSAFELMGRVLLHDYAALGSANDAYQDEREMPDRPGAELGRLAGLGFSPVAVANWEGGVGMVGFLGARPPRPYARIGAAASILCRFSDPDHRFDVGFGAYTGLGFELTRHVGVSIAVNVSNPLVHQFSDSGYWYFLTTTAMLEIRTEGRADRPPQLFAPDPPRTIRRINE